MLWSFAVAQVFELDKWYKESADIRAIRQKSLSSVNTVTPRPIAIAAIIESIVVKRIPLARFWKIVCMREIRKNRVGGARRQHPRFLRSLSYNQSMDPSTCSSRRQNKDTKIASR